MFWLLIRFTFFAILFLFQFSYSLFTDLFRLIALWIVLKLLSVSKFIDDAVSSTTSKEEDSKNSEHKANTNKHKSQSKEGKGRNRPKKSNEDPTFSTTLATPIEDIIEETINEEVKSVNRKKGKSTKNPSKTEELSKKLKPKQEIVDHVGYSFFNVNTGTKENWTAKGKQFSPVLLNEDNQSDDIGFSFLPVKEKGKKYKSKSNLENKDQELTLSGVVDRTLRKSKYDASKPTIIDHYQKRRGNEKVFLKKLATKTEKLQNSGPTVAEKRLLFENQLKVESKESKKVSSTISYASIVVNSVSDIPLDTEANNTIVPNSQVFNGIDSAAENETTSKKSTQNYSSDSINLTESNSSSIEVLNESFLERQHFKESANFEIIENKLNTLLDDGIYFEKEVTGKSNPVEGKVQDNTSKHSSICVIDNQDEFEETNQFYSNKEPLVDIDSRFAQEPKYTTNLDTINTSTVDYILNSEENFTEKSTSNEVVASFENENTTEVENSSYSFESNSHFLSEDTQSSNFSQFSFDSEVENYELESKSEVRTSNYSFEHNYIQTQESVTNSGYLKDFNSIEHSFTDLVGNTNSFTTDISVNYSQSEQVPSENYLLDSGYVIPDGLVQSFEDSGEFFERLETRSEEKPVRDKDISSQFIEEEQCIKKSAYVTGFGQDNQFTEEQPFVKKSSYTVGFESQKFIDEEKSVNERGASVKPNQVKEVNFAEDVSYIPEPEGRSPSEVEEGEGRFTYLTNTDKQSPVESQEESEESNQSTAVEQNQCVVEDITITEEQEHEHEEDFVHVTAAESQNYPEKDTHVQEFVCIATTTGEQTESIKEERVAAEEQSHSVEDQSSSVEEHFVETVSHTTATKQSRIVEESQNNELLFDKMQQIRVLTLNDHEHQECTLYRIEKNWVIQFRVGPSLFGRRVFLYCNYPTKANNKLNEFSRNKYQLLEWATDEGCENADDTALFTQINAELAGSFHYYFTYDKGETLERQGSGYFLVDPVLKYGNNEDLPLDCVQCQTVLAKSLGSFSSWEKKLQVTKESGYNMIHFTPIQELGDSNSAYSLSEQLKLNPGFKKSDGKMPTFDEVERFTSKLRKEWKVGSICDIVLNHTANESKWIQEHPEVSYNCINCPYMRPAYLLDAAWDFFSSQVKKGEYEDRGIPPEVNREDHLNAIRYHFRTNILDPLKIHEMFICDTQKLVVNFLALARTDEPKSPQSTSGNSELKLIQDAGFRRLATSVDMKLALKLFNVYWNDTFDQDTRLKKCAEQFKNKLDELNNRVINEINDHLSTAVENVIAGIRYYRVQPDGPKFKDITIKTPLVYRYFTDYGTPKSLKEFEEIMYSDKGNFLMAHNGWVMSSDPLKNFAAADSKVYLRRELIAWGDSVKLRFGDKPEDCPFLWDHMKKYVEQTARIFDGVRLDNCHSTPIPVAEYLLDCARRVRPDLYVVAELFTNSDMTDNIFVNRLGITSLIREAMSAWDSHEEGRLVHRYGGSPVGSFYQPSIRPLVPTIAHALFLDQTHDNPSPVEKRSVFDLLPSTALINMACCASGSNRGYDELVPHHIHVVDEDREYAEWTIEDNMSMGNLRYVTHKSGIIRAKKAINDLHFLLGKEKFNQVYVDQIDPDIVAVTRHCPVTHQSFILVAFTAFGHPSEDSGNHQRGIKPLRFEGVLEEIVIEATLSHINHKSGGSKFAKFKKFVKDSKWINGLPEYNVSVKQHIQVSESDVFEKVDSGAQNVTQLNFKNFKPGSIVVVKASLPQTVSAEVKTVRSLIGSISPSKQTELSKIVNKMTLSDMNRALYRCDQEERDEGFGFDTYNIPNFGSMVYSGLQGFMSLLANIRPNNDLGHPMCGNLRDGNWMIDFIWKRLKLDPGTKELGEWLEQNTKSFENIPRYLVPCYFDMLVTGIYLVLLEKSHKLMSNFVTNGSTFVKGLALGSVQFGAYIKSADLPTLSPNLAPPKPPTRKHGNETVQACITLSAGLPHFAVGYMRNWGRDTFIALRGLFILTGRYQEAREHILGYAACMRHGLIPNLLDGGRNSRFNCRDAIWWWLYCIKEYVSEAPEGIKILSDKVSRIFPTDDAQNQPPGAVDQHVHEIIQEGLKVHFQGLAFRERNAGKQIDEHMTDEGFNNQIGVHPETGFVFGGNKWNCGTWMDKMGSSDKAGNRSKPATPRDGSAIELIGLSKAVISWLAKLNEENKYPHKGVERVHKSGTITRWTFKEWAQKIQNNFEKHFWVNSKPADGEIRPDLINKRGIYKDSYGSSLEYTDFQLRCNFPIAMVAAPELFTPSHAWEALNQAEKYLLGPLGMKTLDPDDWAYRGDYDNSNQSDDPTVAHGFNYHQGPEWVWPVGFFLRAKLMFAAQNGALKETLASTKLILSKHFVELQTSDWRGLPELTNSNGSYCRDSSRTQAWSMSCVLEVLYDLKRIESSLDLQGN